MQPVLALEIPYRWHESEGRVEVEIRPNEDPEAYGCTEIARGFPVCTARVEHPAIGYADMLGWMQLVNRSDKADGFLIDPLELLTETTHPFGYFGMAPTLFDNPHTDELENWDFFAHTFLCGLGGELLEFRREIRAVLGFSWGLRMRRAQIEFLGPTRISASEWDEHRDYLGAVYAKWSFAEGFKRHPLRP
jgi:hypothetical protein